MTVMNTHSHSKIIDKLGGTSQVAKLCDVKPPSVSGWRNAGIPKSRLMYLRAIRPDVFATKADTEKAA